MRNTEWIKTTLFAHRGFHSEDKSVPENSLAAFKLALEKGYGIELDINILKDGTIVVFHDKDLKRMTGDERFLRDVGYDEIKPKKLLASGEKIPTLKEVLKLVGGRVPLLIELKHHGDYIRLCENFVNLMKDYKGLWAMHSFHPNIVLWFKRNHPEIIRGQISEYFLEEKNMKKSTIYMLKTMRLNFLTKPDFINYGLRDLPNKYCDRELRKGRVVIAYAAKSQADFDKATTHYHNAVFEYFEPKSRPGK